MNTKTKRRSVGLYSISNVRAADKPNEYYVTLTRDGRVVGSVKVKSTSSADGYYNDSETPRLRR